jgi:hypothetical protein
VNRSDSHERALVRWDHDTADGKQIDKAIYAGAERFAAIVAGSRGGRSSSEQRLKGGYALSEARRRLAHRLVIDSRPGGQEIVYLPSKHRAEVVEFLGSDLARRSTLTEDALTRAFDGLVNQFRSATDRLAQHSMVFERSADTRTLKNELLATFVRARSKLQDIHE